MAELVCANCRTDQQMLLRQGTRWICQQCARDLDAALVEYERESVTHVYDFGGEPSGFPWEAFRG